MNMTDPVADMITRVRNGVRAKLPKVDVPNSKLKVEIARILKDEGYIANYRATEDETQGVLRIYLKYGSDKKSVIKGMQRISSPGLRRYVRVEDIPRVLNGLGIAILTTPKGLLTDKKARQQKVGGEVVCHVW